MRVIKECIKRIRRQRRKIVAGETRQGGDHRLRSGHRLGKIVGLIFCPSRQIARQRRQRMQGRAHRGQYHNQNQARLGGQAKGPGQSAASEGPAQDSEAKKGIGRSLCDPLANMPELIVAKFMRKDRQDLVSRVILQKRVEKHDALCLSESRKICIAMCRTPRRVHDIEPARRKTAFAKERLDPLSQGSLWHGAELIEQRSNKGWDNQAQCNCKDYESHPCRKPPKAGDTTREPEKAVKQGDAKRERERQTLDPDAQEYHRGHAIEAEMRFEPKGPENGKRQMKQPLEQGKGNYQCNGAGDAGGEELRHQKIERQK